MFCFGFLACLFWFYFFLCFYITEFYLLMCGYPLCNLGINLFHIYYLCFIFTFLFYIYHFCNVNLKQPVLSSKDFKIQGFFLISYFPHVIRCNEWTCCWWRNWCVRYSVMTSKMNGKNRITESGGGSGTQNFPWSSLIAEEAATLRHEEPMFIFGSSLLFCSVAAIFITAERKCHWVVLTATHNSFGLDTSLMS